MTARPYAFTYASLPSGAVIRVMLLDPDDEDQWVRYPAVWLEGPFGKHYIGENVPVWEVMSGLRGWPEHGAAAARIVEHERPRSA